MTSPGPSPARLPVASPFPLPAPPLYPHSFPTRRSSDLSNIILPHSTNEYVFKNRSLIKRNSYTFIKTKRKFNYQLLCKIKDRKSTRLNSSHVAISYAVFCLKKKKVGHQLNGLTAKTL